MKKGLIFATTLAMALGVGAAVGAQQGKAVRAKAAVNRTVYCAIDPTTLGSYTLKLNANVGDNNTWLQSDMIEVADTTSYPGKKIFKGTFAERWGGVDAMQFQLYDGESWQAQDQVISGWTTYDNYSDKLHVYGGAANSWADYSEPEPAVKYSVTCYVDDVPEEPVEIGEGALPDVKSNTYWKVFDGWYTTDSYDVKVTEITSDCSVYGRFVNKATNTYTLDVSAQAFDAYYLHAWGPDGVNQDWPGVELDSMSFTVPEDVSFIIDEGEGKRQTVNISQEGAKEYLRLLSTTDGSGHFNYEWSDEGPAPVVEYDYKMQIVGKEGLITLLQSKEEGKENEYWLPAEFHFEVGESVKFFRIHEEDSSVIAAGPKEDGLLTKVYVSDAENHVLSFAQEFTGKLMLDISSSKVWADQFTPGYYLAGVDGEWNPKLAMPAEKEAEGDSYAVLDLALAAGSAIKFINAPVEGNDFDWINAYEDKVGSETEVKFTVDGDNNLVVTKAGTYNVYYNPTTGWYGIEDTNPDIPAEEGYYICGEFSGVDCWRFDPNGKMTETSEGGNVAYTMSFTLGVGDEMEVRSYFNDQEPKDRHAILGNVINLEDEGRLFDKNGEHIVARVAGVYDVYAKYEDRDGNPENGTEAFVYYVAEHVDSYKVTMVGVKFAGAAQEGTFALADQLAYVTEPFAPVLHSQDGYVIRGVYTDADCAEEHKYTSTVLDAATTLYVKYTKVGFYVIFGASDYSIDGAMLMNTEGIAGTNKAEAYLPGLEIGDTFSCVYYDGEKAGQDGIGTGAEAYAEYEDSHVKMTVAGSYAVYFGKDNLVYLNAGLVAFLTNFISETGKECKLDETDHVITDVDALAVVWEAQAKIYATLSVEEQGRIKTPDPEDPAKTLIDEFTARYEYIVNKYGTAKFNDFIWNRTIEVADPAYTMSMSAAENSSLIIVISAIAATSALALGALLLIKKRKHQ